MDIDVDVDGQDAEIETGALWTRAWTWAVATLFAVQLELLLVVGIA
jgi:hypothetical protein